MSHKAAVCTGPGQPFQVQTRPTPKPGRGELLIAVKAVALNPADHIMRDLGLFIPSHPAIIGFDMAGLVVEVGEDVPSSFETGVTRVAAYSASFWRGFGDGYGAFQERVVAPWQHAMPVPEAVAWNEAATLPVGVQVQLSMWDAMGIPRLGECPTAAAAAGKKKNEALLVWGASSCVGSMGVQGARLLCDDAGSAFGKVYATAGAANLGYVASLGAHRVFDHRDAGVVNAIVAAAREDGVVIRHCALAVGQLSQCQAVLKAFVGGDQVAKIASAPPVPADAEMIDGLEVMFVQPAAEEEERLKQFEYWLESWGRENLENGKIRPCPPVRVVERKGLEGINEGLDMLVKGVSCEKLVVEIGQ